MRIIKDYKFDPDEGSHFPNAQIVVLTGDGVQISYRSAKKKAQEEKGKEGVKSSLLNYVGRLIPVVATMTIETSSQE